MTGAEHSSPTKASEPGTIPLFPATPATDTRTVIQLFDRALASARDAGPSDKDQRQAQDAVFNALLSFGDRSGPIEHSPSEEFRAVLGDASTQSSRDLLAVCLLRLLPVRAMRILWDKDWRPEVLRLIDSQLNDVCSPEIAALQGHEKLEKLSRLVTRNEEQLQRAIGALTSLERAGACRQQLMSALNSKANKVIFRPFLPPNLDARLGEVFTRLSAYQDVRDEPAVVDARRAIDEEISATIEELHHAGTEYAIWVADGIFRKLNAMVEEDFSTNKAVQPAQVELVVREKTYPLHLSGTTVVIPVYVRNHGPGYAQDVSVMALADRPGRVVNADVVLGRMPPLNDDSVEIQIEVDAASEKIPMLFQLSWSDFDQTNHQVETAITLRAQPTAIDWAAARIANPYSLEPVESDEELVGRQDVLERLVAIFSQANVGSAIIHGQKRVGKTSIAKALRSRAEGIGHLVVYLEGGDYIDPSPACTVRQLGNRVCRLLRRDCPGLEELPIPTFSESLSPLVEYVEDALPYLHGRKLLLILDEFDELPPEVYGRTAVGNAFFLSLRSLTSRPSVGVVLVGGEKMRHVMDGQGDKLNKWSFVPVDYFSREREWDDYRELVRRPTQMYIEFSEEALDAIYATTAGNPYFTHLLCGHIFRAAIEREDCFVSGREVEQVTLSVVRESERNSFQHFWEDGIVEISGEAAERSVSRRRALIALADALARSAPCSLSSVEQHPLVQGMKVEPQLRELLGRNVLKGDASKDAYDFTVPLFLKWLRLRGVREILTTFQQWDEALSARKQAEELRVSSMEIVDLVGRWGTYRGQVITETRVVAWLEQFPDATGQRLMFRLLQHLSFYTEGFMRKRAADITEIVRLAVTPRTGGRLPHGDAIVVTYLDGPAKSGAHFARVYVDACSMRPEDVVEQGQLKARLEREGPPVRAVVMVDDFVGTGKSAVEGLSKLHDEIGDIVRDRDINIVFVAVVSFHEGWRNLQRAAEDLRFGVRLHCCEVLDDSASFFSSTSVVFPKAPDREHAEALARRIGEQLEKRCPLGFGGYGLGVVFERGCPNNSLPILWSESTSPRWVPLFKRR